MNASIRVLICDDHALLRSGLRRLLALEPEIEVVGEAADADEAIARARELEPDVVLLDLVLPSRDGIEALPDVLRAAPACNVLVLSMLDDPGYVRRAFAAGASGYIPKEAADADLGQAIREVAAGRRYVHPLLGARIAAADSAERERAAADPLSQREHEVLRLLVLGHTNQQIAKLLSISVGTAETHRAHIMRKLGLKTRAEIVRYALATGQLDPERVASA